MTMVVIGQLSNVRYAHLHIHVTHTHTNVIYIRTYYIIHVNMFFWCMYGIYYILLIV